MMSVKELEPEPGIQSQRERAIHERKRKALEKKALRTKKEERNLRKNKSRTFMAQIITKSNTPRKRNQDKPSELNNAESEANKRACINPLF